jgi:hypothetical protein
MTMMTTLTDRRDRPGHACRSTRLAALAVVVATFATARTAGAADYTARRFEVAIAVSEAGDLHVNETIDFSFESGTFKRVWREIPASRTDGIEIVEARMDGTPFPRGEGPGRIIVSGENRVRVEWHFPPIGPSTHVFELRYIARGAVYREGDRDVLRWRLLPSEHRYVIDESVTRIATPVGTLDAPRLETRRVSAASASPDRVGLRIEAVGIGANGWVIADLRYPAGSLIASAPEWQQRHQNALSLAPRWAAAAGAIFVLGLFVLLMLRQGYSTATIGLDPTTTTSPPESLPAALAAALTANGRAFGYQGIATLLDLADRGVLRIAELPRSFGVRSYELSQVPGRHELDRHETEAITMAFGGRGDPVPFSRARARLARGGRRFTAAVNADLAERGLLDPDRKAVRDRLTVVSIAMLLGGALGCIAAAPFIPRFDGWPFLLPLGLAAAGIVGIIMAASTTPLSDAGLISAARWRGFRQYLKTLADTPDDARPAAIESRWIVYGIAVGLASRWARFLKRHPGAAPPWFVAASRDDGAAFAAFVGSHGAGAGGGGSAGGGAAGGGGGSGAG